MIAPVVVLPPAVEPVSLEEAKAQCRVTHSAEDRLFELYIAAARHHAENYTKRAFITRTLRLSLNAFPCDASRPIHLPYPPAVSVESIEYVAANGATEQLTDFHLEDDPDGSAIYPAYLGSWPWARDHRGSLRITWKAGYGDDPFYVPEDIRLGVLFWIGHYAANRSDVVTGTMVTRMPDAARAHLDPYRVRSVP